MQPELKKIADLEKILSITMELSSEADLNSLLELIMAKAKEVILCERSTIYMLDREKQELWSLLTSALEIKEIRVPVGVGIAGQVAQNNEIINILNAYEDNRFNPSFDIKTGFKTKSILTIPLRSLRGEVVGVLQMLNRIESDFFSDYDIFIMRTFANQVGVILERSELIKSRLKEERMTNEMELASRIQKKLLPSRTIPFNNIEVTGWNISCDETGGDYFDFFSLENGDVLVAIGDVSGHGISAALIMLEARALFMAFSTENNSVGSILDKMNYFLQKDLDAERFMTFFLGQFAGDGKSFQYSSAGHDGPIWYQANLQKTISLDSTGTVLGFMEGLNFPASESYELSKGDILLFFTDGLFESINEEGQQFGKNNLIELVELHKNSTAEAISQNIKLELEKFCGKQSRQDDITLVVVKIS